MTEQTIRSVAKELAGIFYEDNRSGKFRKAFPTIKHFMRGQWVQDDGSTTIKEPGWTHFIALAKRLMTEMLAKPDAAVSPLMKSRIYDALLDEHSRATSPQAKTITQRQDRPN